MDIQTERLEGGYWKAFANVEFARRNVEVYEISKSRAKAMMGVKVIIGKMLKPETSYKLVGGVQKDEINKNPATFELVQVIEHKK
jgi:hypothetical protein